MVILIGQKPESDFTDPLGMLGDCHRRIERFLAILLDIARQARGAALNEEQRLAMTVALRYFREAAPKHTSDEEDSLFPRLRASGHPQARAALAMLASLHADHELAEARHSEVEALGTAWLAAGHLSPDATQRLLASLNELSALYRAHIAVEDNELFPLAGKILSPDELRAMGQEMAARRGITPLK